MSTNKPCGDCPWVAKGQPLITDELRKANNAGVKITESKYQELKTSVITKLSEGPLDEAYFMRGDKSYTRRELIEEFKSDSSYSMGIYTSLMELTIDLVNRGKETL